MILTIELEPEKKAALDTKAQAQGVSSEQYARQVLEHDLGVDNGQGHISRPIWDVIADTMKAVPREDLAALPKDGASQVDHYLYGHPKRD